MNLSIVAMLFVSFLPFHHHHHKVDPLVSPIDGVRCEFNQGLYSFPGDDYTSGYSPYSCADAFEAWRKTPPLPKMYHL